MTRLLAAILVTSVLLLVAFVARAPETVLLRSPDDAPWIRVDRTFTPQPFGDVSLSSGFRKRFTLDHPIDRVTLRVRVPHTGRVLFDQEQVAIWRVDWRDWDVPQVITLRNLAPGAHELQIGVENQYGPTALAVECDDLPAVSTRDGWEGQELKSPWLPAVSVDLRRPTETSLKFPRPWEALLKIWPWLALVGGMAALWTWLSGGAVKSTAVSLQPLLSPRRLKWICIAAFALLSINNLARGWRGEGFDYPGHVAYVGYLLDHGRLPLARDGIQMFQSPLYYLVGAGMAKCLSLVMPVQQALSWLVVINMVCGAVLIELCDQAGRIAFPDRPRAQSAAVVLGGLLPMNVYFSQYVGNQGLEAVFTALALVLAMKSLAAERVATGWQLTAIGAALGFALLTKVNALVPAAAIITVLAVRSYFAERSLWLMCEDVFFMSAPILAIAGWYYLRNWMTQGKPFIGGWEADGAFRWWQDRGYMTPADFWTFSQGFSRPVQAAFGSLWDGFYSSMWLDAHLGGNDYESRPAWNESWLVAGALLGVLPTLGMLGAAAEPFIRRVPLWSLRLFVTSIAVTLLGAYVVYNLRNPCYASGKAFYVLGGLPLFAVLAAGGIDRVTWNHWMNAILFSLLVITGIASFAAYTILH